MVLRVLIAFLLNLFALNMGMAFTLSPRVEAVTVPGVGNAFQTVTFENTYTNPVPVCTYNLPSASAPPVVVRINAITSTSMQVRIQRFETVTTVTPGTVRCLIAETGVSILPDGRRVEARTSLSTATHGTSLPIGFTPTGMQNISGSFSGFTNPIALGQVISFNDAEPSAFHANDCEDRRNPPFQGGFSDGICVTKHIGQINDTRANETLGIILIERGSGSFDGIAYDAQLGPNNVQGVGNSPPYNYSLSGSFEFAVATMGGENGGNGGWAVFVGGSAVGGTSLGLAVDEEIAAGDTSRTHINEEIFYFVVRRLPLFTASKTVDRLEIAEAVTLDYEIVLENTGELDQTGVVVTDTLPDATTGTVSGPVESITSDGIFEVGEVWTYTVSYPVSAADISSGANLINTVSVTTDQYAAESLADETALATTIILPALPSITVTKTADNDTNVPAGVTVTYTYVVTNTGNQTISNISLADAHNASGPVPVPGNETLTTDNGISNDSSDSSIDGVWDSLAPGDEVTFTATYTVTQNDIDTLQ